VKVKELRVYVVLNEGLSFFAITAAIAHLHSSTKVFRKLVEDSLVMTISFQATLSHAL
jgi:hypothetical protein